MTRLLSTVCAAALALSCAAADAATLAITNAKVMTAGPAGAIANGTVVVRDGKIVAVGASVAVPAGAQVVDAKGATLVPGFVATNSMLGAVEIGSLGNDVAIRTPDLGAAFDVQYALNPWSVVIPVARLGGITSAVVTPRPSPRGGGGDDQEERAFDLTAGAPDSEATHSLFAGQAAVIELGHDQAPLMRAKVAMVSPFGEAGAEIAGGARGAEVVLLKEALADVRAYAANRAAYNSGAMRELSLSRADLEALVPVVQGRMPLIAVANQASDIRAILQLAREEKLQVIISGGAEAWRVAPELAAQKVPVLVNSITDRPDSMETLGATLENAARLQAAGVVIAIEGQGGAHRAHETRYNAGIAVANGLPYDAALAALTINPARIFGVADRVGSIEPGKDADMVLWSGDPFEPLSRPQLILVRGEAQPLTSRQLELRDRYKDLNRPYPPQYTK